MNLRAIEEAVKKAFPLRNYKLDNFSKRIPSAVIIPIFEKNSEPFLLFIRKTEDNSPHSGQVSFPGGCKEESDKSILDTALREFEEETGIKKEMIQVIGSIEPVPTRSTPFIIFPFIGIIKNKFSVSPDKREVAKIFFVPFKFLLKEYPFKHVNYNYKGLIFRTPLIEYEGEIIWGATARILEIFLEGIKSIDNNTP